MTDLQWAQALFELEARVSRLERALHAAPIEPCADTQPAPPPEPVTTPGTGEARKRSSDRLQAVKPGGLAERVADELARGKR